MLVAFNKIAKKDEDIVSDKNNLFCFETVRL